MKRRNARWLQASWMKSYKKMVPGEQQSFRRRRRLARSEKFEKQPEQKLFNNPIPRGYLSAVTFPFGMQTNDRQRFSSAFFVSNPRSISNRILEVSQYKSSDPLDSRIRKTRKFLWHIDRLKLHLVPIAFRLFHSSFYPSFLVTFFSLSSSFSLTRANDRGRKI